MGKNGSIPTSARELWAQCKRKLIGLLGGAAILDLVKEYLRGKFMDWLVSNLGFVGRYIFADVFSLFTFVVAVLLLALIVLIAKEGLTEPHLSSILDASGRQFEMSRRDVAGLAITASVCLALVGFGAYTYHKRILRPYDVHEMPHIQAQMLIDSVTKDRLMFHLVLENIGHVTAHNIRASIATANSTEFEQTPPTERLLPPNGRISLVPAPLFKFGPYGSVFVRLEYTADRLGSSEPLSSGYRFFFSAEEMKSAHPLNPEGWTEAEGTVQTQGLIYGLLSSKSATVFMVIPEIVNANNFNLVQFSDSSKRFLFDPLFRRVSFRFTLQNGRTIELLQPLPRNPKALHIVTLVWDATRGSALRVDGRQTGNLP